MDKNWKTPNEIIRLQRLKQKQKALQARLDRPLRGNTDKAGVKSSFSKRKNPFLDQRETISSKKIKSDLETNDFASEDSIFNLLSAVSVSANTAKTPLTPANQPTGIKNSLHSFESLIKQQSDAEESEEEVESVQIVSNHVPIDWGLKTKLRILSNTVIPGARLKTNEEASGITGFVRCMDSKAPGTTTGLDISPATLFHQSTMYWQHPHIPWLTLFPRMAKANNTGLTIGEAESAALESDWTDSFRALFQLVRALQCPYFYLCANSFTVLFRAAGVGGFVETHAFLTPTSRGFRAALKQQDIEYTMPLRPSADKENPNKSLDSGTETQCNSLSNFSDDTKLDNSKENTSGNLDEGLDEGNSDEEDEEQWLASLGVEASEIKKISTKHARRIQSKEGEDDATDQSIILVEGVECQALFNFLLNAKSTITKVGRLAGVPPTLLSPVAFPGATLKKLQVRASVVRMDNIDYHSMELKGPILPHILHYLCNLLRQTKDKFSATMVNFPSTCALSKASQKKIDDLNKSQNKETTSENVFGRENLSDSGMQSKILEDLCRVSSDAVRSIERMCYNNEQGGYTWA